MCLLLNGLKGAHVFSGGLRVAISYPLLMKILGGKHYYEWQTQTFSVENCPDRWLPALSLLLAHYWQTRHPTRYTPHKRFP